MNSIKHHLQSNLDKRFSSIVSIGAKILNYLSDDTGVNKHADLISNFDTMNQLIRNIDTHAKRNS
jgi:hypothetical protein